MQPPSGSKKTNPNKANLDCRQTSFKRNLVKMGHPKEGIHITICK